MTAPKLTKKGKRSAGYVVSLTRRQFALFQELRRDGARDLEGLRGSTYRALIDADLAYENGMLRLSERARNITLLYGYEILVHPALKDGAK